MTRDRKPKAENRKPKTERLTTAQAILRFLAAQHVERDGRDNPFFAGIFGIFGHGNVTGIGQALEEHPEQLRFYRAQNEQGMVHIASGYAKMKNRLQAFACTSSVGPGATNMVTGAATATVNRLPVLLLPGDTFASRLPHPVLQQLEYPLGQDISVNDTFRPVSRYWDRINRPEQILSSLPAAVRILTDQAKTGAVTIALPEDVQTEAYDFPAAFLEKRIHRIPRIVPAEEGLWDAVSMIRNSHAPLIIAGGGVIYSEASGALNELASRCGIPVSETQAGKGALSWDHAWNAGPIGANGGLAANRLARDADLVISIGTRLADFTTASHSAFQNPAVRFISINLNDEDASKLGGLAVIGDARASLCELTHRLLESDYRTTPEYEREVRALKQEWDATVDGQRGVAGGALTQANAIGIVNEHSRPGDVVVCAAGGLPGDLLKLWRVDDPKGYHVEYGYSCMGYEIAGALGAKMADPSREVYVMVGDGSYLMLNGEIVTSLQEGYKLIIILVDNGGFQCIRGLQESSGSPSFGNELRFRDRESGRLDGPYIPIDFAKHAESMGAVAFTAVSPQSLLDALRQAKEETRTVLIHMRVDVDARVPSYEGWWDVPVAVASGEASIEEARRAYDRARRKQRFYY